MLRNISNKCCSLIFMHQIKFFQKYEAVQLFSKLIIIRNVCWASKRHIIMISEESCDTKDWSKDAENSALITAIYYIFTQKIVLWNCNNISHYYSFYCIFHLIHAALVRNFLTENYFSKTFEQYFRYNCKFGWVLFWWEE